MKLHTDVVNKNAINAFKTLEARFNNMHAYKYNYDKTIYKGTKELLNIECLTHGKFTQRSSDHLAGNGCQECAKEAVAQKNSKSLNTSLKDVIGIHGERYDMSKIVYKNSDTEVTLICDIHGEFNIQPRNLLSGCGCTSCGLLKRDKSLTKSTKDFIQEATNIHKGKGYDYSQTQYTNSKTPVGIVCPKHGLFYKTPSHHLQGQGCPFCSNTGFKTNRPGLLYYFQVTDGTNTAWKIGVTNLSIEDRYTQQEKARMSNIISVWYKDGAECYAEEQRIIKENNTHKYIGPNLLRNGNTELFSADIFSL